MSQDKDMNPSIDRLGGRPRGILSCVTAARRRDRNRKRNRVLVVPMWWKELNGHGVPMVLFSFEVGS